MSSNAGTGAERRVDEDGARRLVPPIVLAFSADPFVRWILPDPATFLGTFTKVTEVHAEVTAAAGGAFGRPDDRGGAFWYPPGVHPDGERLGDLFRSAGALERVQAAFGAAAAHEPSEPHWYLRQIGIDPSLQRNGHGSALMDAALREVDADGGLGYLEATTSASRDFYARYGFITLDEVQTMDSPPLWPMVRPRS